MIMKLIYLIICILQRICESLFQINRLLIYCIILITESILMKILLMKVFQINIYNNLMKFLSDLIILFSHQKINQFNNISEYNNIKHILEIISTHNHLFKVFSSQLSLQWAFSSLISYHQQKHVLQCSNN